MKIRPLLLLVLFLLQAFNAPATSDFVSCCQQEIRTIGPERMNCCQKINHTSQDNKKDNKKSDEKKGCCSDKCTCHHLLKTLSTNFESQNIIQYPEINFRKKLNFAYLSLLGNDLKELIFQPPRKSACLLCFCF